MSLPIPIPETRRRSASAAHSPTSTSPSSYSDGSTGSSWTPAGVYVPVHKRHASSEASSLGKDNAALSSTAAPHARIYPRAALLALARSPLAHQPAAYTGALAAAFPLIIRPHGHETARALDMSVASLSAGAQASPSRHRRRGRKSGGFSAKAKRDSSRSSEGSEGSWRDHSD